MVLEADPAPVHAPHEAPARQLNTGALPDLIEVPLEVDVRGQADPEMVRGQPQEHLHRVVEGQQRGRGERLRVPGLLQPLVIQEPDERKTRDYPPR